MSVFAGDVDCLVDKFLFSAVNDKEFSVAGGTITSYLQNVKLVASKTFNNIPKEWINIATLE